MKKKRQSVIILVMTLLLGMQSVLVANAAIAGEEIENVLNVDASDAQTSYEPEALPVLIGEEVSDSVFEESGDFSAMGNVPTCTVKTKKEFMNKLHKYLNKRKTKFVIQFKGSYKKIYKNSVENMFQQAWNIDNKKTSNDFDYLPFVKYNPTITLNNLIFDKNLLPKELSYKETLGKIVNLHKSSLEQKQLESSVKLMTDIENLEKNYKSLKDTIKNLDKELTKSQLIVELTKLHDTITQFKSLSNNYNEEVWDGDLHCIDMYYYSKEFKII